MKRNNHFILRYLGDVPYLLPYGQAQQEFKKSCRLNKGGAFLWDLLEQECSLEELVRAYAAHYDISAQDLSELRSDLKQFIDNLTVRGCLEESPLEFSSPDVEKRFLRAGSLTLRLEGAPQAFSQQFDSFYCDQPDTVDQTVLIRPFSPSQHMNGNVLLRCDELTILDTENQYILLFPSKTQVEEAHLSKDASRVVFYCRPPCNDTFREELFHAIRFSFLVLAQTRHMAVLHSASFLYQGKAWLFSAPSGTGKSTHTNLWKELHQVPLLNGDLNLLAVKDGKPVIHGIPWCGTSEIRDKETYPLGGIILLRQAEEDRVEELSPDVQRLFILQRLISPSWTPRMLDCNLQLIDKLIPQIYVARLHCTKNASAVNVMKAGIDGYLKTTCQNYQKNTLSDD